MVILRTYRYAAISRAYRSARKRSLNKINDVPPETPKRRERSSAPRFGASHPLTRTVNLASTALSPPMVSTCRRWTPLTSGPSRKITASDIHLTRAATPNACPTSRSKSGRLARCRARLLVDPAPGLPPDPRAKMLGAQDR